MNNSNGNSPDMRQRLSHAIAVVMLMLVVTLCVAELWMIVTGNPNLTVYSKDFTTFAMVTLNGFFMWFMKPDGKPESPGTGDARPGKDD